MITGHGGNVGALARQLGCAVDEIKDMSCNLNPLGPPRGLEDFLQKHIGKIRSLPAADAREMVGLFSQYYGLPSDRVLAGNGTTQFIYTLPLALNIRKLLIAGPTYSDYRDACFMHQRAVTYSMAVKEDGFKPDLDRISDLLENKKSKIDGVVICNPNNPTGALVQKADLIDLIERHPEIYFVIDESYLPFVTNADKISLVSETRFDNLMVLSSMSKIFRMPGLRTGYICADPGVINRFSVFYQPWSVNALAQAAVVHIFENYSLIDPFLETTRDFIDREKKVFLDALSRVAGIQVYDSQTYFVLARLTGAMTGQDLCRAVGQEKILIRDCANFEGLSPEFVRFSLKTRDQNMKLAEIVARILASAETCSGKTRRVS